MHRYHEQLKEDLQALIAYKARKEEYVPEDLDSLESFAESSLELHNYANDKGQKVPLGEITGIIAEQLPPPDRFTAEQRAELSPLLEQVASEYDAGMVLQVAELSPLLEQVLHLFHFELDFPEATPDEMRYAFIRRFWSESHLPMQVGYTYIEFCDYDEEHCPFPSLCPACAQVRANFEHKKRGWDDDEEDIGIPF